MDDHASHGAYSWRDYFKVNTDHKVIGIQYLATTFFFFVAGGLMAMIFRAELANPDMQYVDTQTFNGLVSEHAALMIFLFIIPAFAGLANFAVPLMLGAPDMAFPRLNALSFWLLPIAGIMFLAAFLAPGGAFATGWTSYAPLAVDQPLGQVFFNMGVQWAGASSIMTALNFLVTIITMRAPGMTFWRMPLLVWANFTTSLLVVIATPFIAGSQFFVMFDRIMHTNFFNVAEGGYVLGYQHIFWFYSHPAVYIMMLPGFGIISEVLAVMCRKPVFGYRLMALSLMAILVLGFSVWAHHMFVAGMAPWLRVPMMVTSMIIAVPTGIKVFSWLATMWEGKLHFRTPMLFALGFLSMFVLGGLSGIFLASVPIDIAASDTYFIVAHIHYVLFGGSVFTIFAGIYYWFPKMTGRMYNERLGKLHFWLTFIGFNGTFFPMHWVGLQGMPRRVADYSAEFGDWNLVISMFSFLLGASTIVFFYNVIASWARGPIAPSNPWRALTLEWQVTSPPPVFNFDEIPQVVGSPYEYGVPGAKHAVLNGGAGAAAKEEEGGRPVSEQRKILVVANETLNGEELLDAVRKRVAGSDALVLVIAPVNAPREGYVVYENTRRAAAGRRLDKALQQLRDAGIPASGHVVDNDPLAAVKDTIAMEEPDELVVSTHPEAKSGWRRRDLLEEIRKAAGDRPVEHVVSDVASRTGAQNILVVANETVLGAPLLDRIREKARAGGEGTSFLIVSPQSDPDRGAHPEADRRLRQVLAQLRSEGIEAHGQIAHPGPVHGGDARRSRREHRRHPRLHLPGAARIVWLRRDLIGRLTSEAGVPVEHVVVEPAEVRFERARRRPAPRPPDREPELADRVDGSRHVPLHRVGGDALRRLLHGVLLHSRRQPGSRAVAAPALPPASVRGGREHGGAADVELHDALGAAVDQARQPGRHEGRARAHAPDGPRLPADADARVRADRVQPLRRGVRDDLLRPHRPARRACLRRADAALDGDRARISRPLHPGAPPRGRDPRNLLALRRRNVDRGVRDDLPALAMARNPVPQRSRGLPLPAADGGVLRADRGRSGDRDVARPGRFHRPDGGCDRFWMRSRSTSRR